MSPWEHSQLRAVVASCHAPPPSQAVYLYLVQKVSCDTKYWDEKKSGFFQLNKNFSLFNDRGIKLSVKEPVFKLISGLELVQLHSARNQAVEKIFLDPTLATQHILFLLINVKVISSLHF